MEPGERWRIRQGGAVTTLENKRKNAQVAAKANKENKPILSGKDRIGLCESIDNIEKPQILAGLLG